MIERNRDRRAMSHTLLPLKCVALPVLGFRQVGFSTKIIKKKD